MSYVDPSAPSTTVYEVQDGVVTEDQIKQDLPNFDFPSYVEVPTLPKTYPLHSYAGFVYGISALHGKVGNGTAVITVKVDDVAVQGLENITLTNTMQTFLAAQGQGVNVGQRLTWEATGGSGIPRDLEFTLACTR